ncbi:HEAT repeat domain-containing protein [Dictyobacter formicarum]|uniref:HEAT repeat domain-containing protein n=1 Tax=Dictyobacter formicarum TaxID=2778368 RepID=A0ABQ3VA36_9CHLR|nr:HEAT repeat domain-containing protein [Dictyobacter formicarum]GHO82699.1 hypothetical protein KSZ_07050 [Dictyobacter formicarum]
MKPREILPQATFQAPETLSVGLQARLEAYQQARANLAMSEELEKALSDPRWEVRCAVAERLSAQSPRRHIESALNDKDHCVRQAAVRALGCAGSDAPLDLLQERLRDEHWQVREVTLLTAGEFHLLLPISMIEDLLHDESEPVRQAARYALERLQDEKDRVASLPIHLLERTKPSLFARSTPKLSVPASNSPTRRRRFSPLKAGLLAAALLVVFAALSAAGFGLGWWSPLLGNPDQYTTLNQEKTIDGVTVRLLKVYLDQGRTAIVYDTFSPATKDPFRQDGSTLTSAYPQTQGAVTGGGYVQIDKQDPQLRHIYTVYKAFVVPASVDSLTVTWTVTMVSGEPKLGTGHSLAFTFSFSAPFHHVNDPHVTDPYKSGAGA